MLHIVDDGISPARFFFSGTSAQKNGPNHGDLCCYEICVGTKKTSINQPFLAAKFPWFIDVDESLKKMLVVIRVFLRMGALNPYEWIDHLPSI